MNKIIEVINKGGPEKLKINTVQTIAPLPDEVSIKVHAFALNQADLLYMNGIHFTELKLPSRIGSEASGIIAAVGSNVTQWEVGDKVSTIPYHMLEPERHGVQGEFALVPATFLAPWPTGYTSIQACSFWMQYLTAYFSMKIVGEIGPGKSVLIIAGSSSAGLGAIQIAKYLGANVIATTRSEHKREIILKTGADIVINTVKGEKFDQELLNATNNKGVDLVFDPVAGEFVKRYIEGLNRRAKILVYGMLDGDMEIHVPALPMARSQASLQLYSMFNHVDQPEELKEAKFYILNRIALDNLKPMIDSVFTLDNTISGYQHMLNNAQCGKIVVSIID